MPTDKNKISAYLDDKDFGLLDELASEHRISKSQAVILAIRYLAGNVPSPQKTPSPAMDRVEFLESQLKTLISRVESLELAQQEQTTVNSIVVSSDDAKPEDNPLGLIPGELYPTRYLAELFGVRTQTIANWFGEPPKTPPSTPLGLKYEGKLNKISAPRSKPVLYRYKV